MSYQIFNLPRSAPLNSGVFMPGAKAEFFLTGTTTPTPVYTTSALNVAHTQPVEADAAGIFPAIYLDADISYKVTISSAADVLLYTQDPVNDDFQLSQDDIGEALYPLSGLETASSTTPTDYSYPHGDPRRASIYSNANWLDYHDVGTFISTTSFSIPTDVTTRYPIQRYLRFISSAGAESIGRITNAVFGAGITTFTMSMEVGSVPNPVAGVMIAMGMIADYPLGISYDINSIPTGPLFWNKSNGTGAVSRIQVVAGTSGSGSDIGLAIVAIQNIYSGAYLPGGLTGRHIVLHTGVAGPILIGVQDTPKCAFTVGNSPTRFYTDVEVNNNQSGATLSNLIIDGTTGVSRLTLKNSGTERGFLAALNTGPEILFGTNSALDVSFVYNGARVLTLNGANATGASTPTLSANKPGANAGVITWLSVKTGAGTQGYIPVFGA